MTKEEQLKIYAAYLPYGLKIGFQGEDHEHSLVGLELSSEGVMLISPYGDFGRARIEDCKPILYSLSYLTKEIEHNCAMIKPIEYVCTSKSDREKTIKMIENNEPLDGLAYWKIEKLLKFHFNVFNLDESEFINKATLTNK